MTDLNNLTQRHAARTIGALMLIQMVLGLLLNFYFLKPILRYDGSLSVDETTLILGCATLCALIISSLNLVFGLLLPPNQLKKYFRTFIAMVVFASIGMAFSVYEYAQLSEYVSFLTTTYQTGLISDNATMEYLKTALATGRNEAHFSSIFISSCSLLVFYILVHRIALIPSLLSVFALVATSLQLIAVGHTFFQSAIPNLYQAPLALTQLIVPIYLIVTGFKSQSSTPSDHLQPSH